MEGEAEKSEIRGENQRSRSWNSVAQSLVWDQHYQHHLDIC